MYDRLLTITDSFFLGAHTILKVSCWGLILLLTQPVSGAQRESSTRPPSVHIERLGDGPIIRPSMDNSMGSNINGPSLIKVPDWIENPLGQYYLYFADHRGTYIRLAYADDLLGPWFMHESGTLRLNQTHFSKTPPLPNTYVHIASPDVHVREDRQEIVMYVHGQDTDGQVTRVSTSKDGLNFTGKPAILGRPYFRVFNYEKNFYALAMPGIFYRSRTGISNFERGPKLFNPDMRHSAVLVRNGTLNVFWTQAGHAPERILLSTIDLAGSWTSWTESNSVEVLRPQEEWEGASFPVTPSQRGAIDQPVNQLRDPAIFQENGRTFILYTVAGEHGIAIAEIHFDN